VKGAQIKQKKQTVVLTGWGCCIFKTAVPDWLELLICIYYLLITEIYFNTEEHAANVLLAKFP